MAMVKINTAYNVNIDFDLAGLDKRFFAWLIDFAIRAIYLYIVLQIAISIFYDYGLDNGSRQESAIIFYTLSLLPIFFYFLLLEVFFNGQSIGKKILKIRVASIEGYKPTATQYLTRWVFRLVDLGFISLSILSGGNIFTGWIAAIFLIPNAIGIFLLLNSKKEQRLGDLASGTVVIKLKPSTHIKDTIFEAVSKEYRVIYADVLKLSDRDVTIIKNALITYDKSGNDHTLWLIAEKLKTVLHIKEIGNPYDMLDTVIKDYNFLTAN
jgi:uncharacterized RDD family membrane protein YckC